MSCNRCHLSLFRNFNIITKLYNDVKRFSSSSRLSTAFTFSRSRAAPFSPFVYHATCFRISRMPENSPLILQLQPGMSEHHFPHLVLVRPRTGVLPVSSQCIISEKIQGFPCAPLAIMMPSHPVCLTSSVRFLRRL